MLYTLGRSFNSALKMAVAPGRNAPNSKLRRIKIEFRLRQKKPSKTRLKQAWGVLQYAMEDKRLCSSM